MTAKLTAWSYSRYACWELCPLQFKLKFLDKLGSTGSPAMERGDKIHKNIAAYIVGNTETLLPDVLKNPLPLALVNELRAFPVSDKLVEQQWGFTAQWKPTGWFGNTTWFRAILDAAAMYEDMTGDVVDWKTGKKYGTAKDQMELNALSFMNQYQLTEAVTSRMVYIDTNDEDQEQFKVADKEKLRAKWEAKVTPMFADEMYLPRPNDKCRFCDFSKSKGGQCRFG